MENHFRLGKFKWISTKPIYLVMMKRHCSIIYAEVIYVSKWIFKFYDVNRILLAEKKIQLIEPFITHGVLFGSLRKNFRSSLVLELLWEDNINFQFKNFTTLSKKILKESVSIISRDIFKFCNSFLKLIKDLLSHHFWASCCL